MTDQILESALTGTVYVRRIPVQDLPDRLQAEAREGGLDDVYALHRPDGEQVALVGDRGMAFALARQNDLRPVSVH